MITLKYRPTQVVNVPHHIIYASLWEQFMHLLTYATDEI
jgi:hypothetical protein